MPILQIGRLRLQPSACSSGSVCVLGWGPGAGHLVLSTQKPSELFFWSPRRTEVKQAWGVGHRKRPMTSDLLKHLLCASRFMCIIILFSFQC